MGEEIVKRGRGRPSPYTEEQKAEFKRLAIEGVTAGMSLRKVCRENGWPEGMEGTIRLWVAYDVDFATQYMHARQCRADARSDRIDDICELVASKELDPSAAQVIIGAERWQAGRENSKRYAERTTIQGADDAPPVKTQADLSVADKRDLARWIAQHLAAAGEQSGDSEI